MDTVVGGTVVAMSNCRFCCGDDAGELSLGRFCATGEAETCTNDITTDVACAEPSGSNQFCIGNNKTFAVGDAYELDTLYSNWTEGVAYCGDAGFNAAPLMLFDN